MASNCTESDITSALRRATQKGKPPKKCFVERRFDSPEELETIIRKQLEGFQFLKAGPNLDQIYAEVVTRIRLQWTDTCKLTFGPPFHSFQQHKKPVKISLSEIRNMLISLFNNPTGEQLQLLLERVERKFPAPSHAPLYFFDVPNIPARAGQRVNDGYVPRYSFQDPQVPTSAGQPVKDRHTPQFSFQVPSAPANAGQPVNDGPHPESPIPREDHMEVAAGLKKRKRMADDEDEREFRASPYVPQHSFQVPNLPVSSDPPVNDGPRYDTPRYNTLVSRQLHIEIAAGLKKRKTMADDDDELEEGEIIEEGEIVAEDLGSVGAEGGQDGQRKKLKAADATQEGDVEHVDTQGNMATLHAVLTRWR